MKITINSRGNAGGALWIALITCSVIGVVLTSYLTLIRAQNITTMRAQAWNDAMPVAEAGIEEALTHINTNGSTNWAANGWTLSGSVYTKTRDFTNYTWTTTISATDPPTIISTGRVATVVNGMFLAAANIGGINTTNSTFRVVRVQTTRDGLFTKAMVAKNTIDMNGNNIKTDSFDSSNPLYSTNGMYDPNPNKVLDNGDIATNSGIINSISVGNADIWGHASTGPGGSLSIGSNGAVGSKAWVTGGNSGVQPGWFKDDMNVSFPDVVQPFTSGFTPGSGSVTGTNYTYLLTNGNYLMSSMSMSGQNKMYVSGDAVLVITGNMSMSGQSKIILATNASLKIYVKGASASLGGNGVANNTGKAEKFAFLGLPTNTSLSLGGNAAFNGVIYAPSADFTLGGGGNNTLDFVGSSVTKTVKMNGHFNFHYDENLKKSQWGRGYVVSGWDEI